MAAPVEVPTGNGFCLYVKRGLIDAIGLFDDRAFPEGYGEENDFCMRALAAGWYNVVDPRTWVHHVRSASFGNRREALAKAGAERMDEMHPNYSRSEEHTSELQSLMRNSYAVFCLKK